jgi:hypothetical protein
MNLDKLNSTDAEMLRRIRQCDIEGAKTVTFIVLIAGIVVALALLIFGAATGSVIALLAGSVELLVAIIVSAGRFSMLRVYRLVQLLHKSEPPVL